MAGINQAITGAIDMLTASVQSSQSGNYPALLMLDTFKFSLNTIVFAEMRRSTGYEWAAIKRFGQTDALQFTGPGDDVISLPCVLYPDWLGSTSSITTLKAMAAAGKPYSLIGSTGVFAGYWVITQTEEVRSYFKADGSVRKAEINLTLKYYGSNLPN